MLGTDIMRLEPRPDSVRAARRFVVGALDGALDGALSAALVEAVVLLTSEVVTNAIRHGGPYRAGEDVVVRIGRTGDDAVRVEVQDRNLTMPARGDGSTDAPSGRGVLLVEELARSWGVTPDGTGKVVWFEVT